MVDYMMLHKGYHFGRSIFQPESNHTNRRKYRRLAAFGLHDGNPGLDDAEYFILHDAIEAPAARRIESISLLKMVNIGRRRYYRLCSRRGAANGQ